MFLYTIVRSLVKCSGQNHRSRLQLLFASGTNGFKRAVLRRLLSTKGREFHLAPYRAICFKFSFEHQRSRVAPDVAEQKFNRPRKRDGVSFALSPACHRRLGGSPDLQSWIEQQERAFSSALSVKAQ